MFWFLSISEMVFSIWLPIFTVINRLNLEILIRFHSKEMQIFLQIFLPSLSRNIWDEPDFFSPVNISAETETISLLLLFLPCFRVQGKRNFQTFAYFPLSRPGKRKYLPLWMSKQTDQPTWFNMSHTNNNDSTYFTYTHAPVNLWVEWFYLLLKFVFRTTIVVELLHLCKLFKNKESNTLL